MGRSHDRRRESKIYVANVLCVQASSDEESRGNALCVRCVRSSRSRRRERGTQHSRQGRVAASKCTTAGCHHPAHAVRCCVRAHTTIRRISHFCFARTVLGRLRRQYDVTFSNRAESKWTREHQMSVNRKFSGITFDDLRLLDRSRGRNLATRTTRGRAMERLRGFSQRFKGSRLARSCSTDRNSP